VCVCVCVCVCVHVSSNTHTYTQTHSNTHTRTHSRTHTYRHVFRLDPSYSRGHPPLSLSFYHRYMLWRQWCFTKSTLLAQDISNVLWKVCFLQTRAGVEEAVRVCIYLKKAWLLQHPPSLPAAFLPLNQNALVLNGKSWSLQMKIMRHDRQCWKPHALQPCLILCTYTCARIHAQIRTYVCMYVCIRSCMCIHTFTYVRAYARTYKQTCINVCGRAQVQTKKHAYACDYMYIHTYVHASRNEMNMSENSA